MLTAGMALHTSSIPSVSGTLGVILKDRVGTILALTSCELLSLASDCFVHDAKGVRIGRRPSSYYAEESSSNSPERLLGWFIPEGEIAIEPYDLWDAGDASAFLGAKAVIWPAVGQTTGRVRATDCGADFSLNGIADDVAVEGLLIVQIKAAQVVDYLGWSGAAVTIENRLAGVVVGVCDDELLVAPIHTLLQAEGMELASQQDIAKFNDQRLASHAVAEAMDEGLETIADMIGISDTGDWHRSIGAWAAVQWRRAQNGHPDAFAPFTRYFVNMAEKQLPALEHSLHALSLDMANAGVPPPRVWETFAELVYDSISSDAFPQTTSNVRESDGGSHSWVARFDDAA